MKVASRSTGVAWDRGPQARSPIPNVAARSGLRDPCQRPPTSWRNAQGGPPPLRSLADEPRIELVLQGREVFLVCAPQLFHLEWQRPACYKAVFHISACRFPHRETWSWAHDNTAHMLRIDPLSKSFRCCCPPMREGRPCTCAHEVSTPPSRLRPEPRRAATRSDWGGCRRLGATSQRRTCGAQTASEQRKRRRSNGGARAARPSGARAATKRRRSGVRAAQPHN